MKKSIYPRLAWSGIVKNRKLYFPYILSCMGMVMMFYIIHFLSYSPLLHEMKKGGSSLEMILSLGKFVIAVFALLFLFYTNSFLIRRRYKEFGLFNVLGMDKHSISRIILRESLIVSAFGLIGGMGLGIVFSKLAELGLLNAIHGAIDYRFTIPAEAITYTLIIFGIIFLLLTVKSLWQVRRCKPLELLRSENFGEKPPKANWVFAVLGVIILGVAYYLAVSIKTPLTAFTLFFVAVIMVIIATYLLFMSGSVALCKILQKNRKYYYQKQHFVSVSSMVYRMKRNGAGLASVCILITMVLVMIASTSCLYFGKNDVLRSQYPHDFNFTVDFDTLDEVTQENIDKTKAAIDAFMDKNGGISFGICGKSDRVTGELRDGVFYMGDDVYDPEYSSFLYIIDLADYNRNTGSSYRLNDGEALVFASSRTYDHDTIRIEGGREYKVVKSDGTIDFIRDTDMLGFSAVYIVVPDFYSSAEDLLQATEKQGVSQPWLQWRYQFDSPADHLTQLEIEEGIWDVIAQAHSGGYGLSSLAGARDDFYGSFGGLFFLGIMLSIVFIIAAVLIIYYKQVSEGYEDQSRFEIMQKVGMTKKDIRKSINSQMLTVFFLPLLFAIVHLGFAFPMINKLLLLFGLDNLGLLLLTAAISALVFALFYIIVYRVTSNAYYSIVSGAKE